jgi:hypothetical protein
VSLFHIAAANGDTIEAWWNSQANFVEAPVRFLQSVPLLIGGHVHVASPYAESDNVLTGSGTVLDEYVEALRTIQLSSNTTWEFSNGLHAWLVVFKAFTLIPAGGGKYTLAYELPVVRRLTP